MISRGAVQIVYSIIVLGLLIIVFLEEGSGMALLLFFGLALGCWGGAMFPWDNFKD